MSFTPHTLALFGLVLVVAFGLLVACWDYHPEDRNDLAAIQHRDITDRVQQLDLFLTRVQAQALPEEPELVVELGNQPRHGVRRKAA